MQCDEMKLISFIQLLLAPKITPSILYSPLNFLADGVNKTLDSRHVIRHSKIQNLGSLTFSQPQVWDVQRIQCRSHALTL
jgi:hypothetical protein